MMFLLGIPLYIGICVFDVAMEKTYRDQVALKLKLEDHLRHDALTGAYNRNVFESLVGEITRLSAQRVSIWRSQCMIWTSLSVLMICMDIRLEMKH